MDYKDYQAGMSQSHCWFKGKAGLIDTLLKKLESKEKLKILDVGVGTGEDLHIITKFGELYVIDISQEALDLIPENLIKEKIIGDVCKIPYSDNSFDLVVAFDVLEHIKEDQLAVKEIKRVLKNDGDFVFTVPAFNILFGNHDKDLNHFRRYNKNGLKRLLKEFNNIVLSYWMFFLFFPTVIFRLITTPFISKEKQSKAQKNLPKTINFILLNILNFENWLISKGFTLPVGLTLYGSCKVKKIIEIRKIL